MAVLKVKTPPEFVDPTPEELVVAWQKQELLDFENQKPYAKYPLDCQVCCICEAACPEKALEVVPDWSKKYYPSYISTMRGQQ